MTAKELSADSALQQQSTAMGSGVIKSHVSQCPDPVETQSCIQTYPLWRRRTLPRLKRQTKHRSNRQILQLRGRVRQFCQNSSKLFLKIIRVHLQALGSMLHRNPILNNLKRSNQVRLVDYREVGDVKDESLEGFSVW